MGGDAEPDYFFVLPGAFMLLPCELADTTPALPAPFPLALTVVAATLLVLLEPDVTVVVLEVVLVPALLPFEPEPFDLAPVGLSLDSAAEPLVDPPDAVETSVPDDL